MPRMHECARANRGGGFRISGPGKRARAPGCPGPGAGMMGGRTRARRREQASGTPIVSQCARITFARRVTTHYRVSASQRHLRPKSVYSPPTSHVTHQRNVTPHTHAPITISLHTTSDTTTPGVPTGHDQATTNPRCFFTLTPQGRGQVTLNNELSHSHSSPVNCVRHWCV